MVELSIEKLYSLSIFYIFLKMMLMHMGLGGKRQKNHSPFYILPFKFIILHSKISLRNIHPNPQSLQTNNPLQILQL